MACRDDLLVSSTDIQHFLPVRASGDHKVKYNHKESTLLSRMSNTLHKFRKTTRAGLFSLNSESRSIGTSCCFQRCSVAALVLEPHSKLQAATPKRLEEFCHCMSTLQAYSQIVQNSNSLCHNSIWHETLWSNTYIEDDQAWPGKAGGKKKMRTKLETT